MKATSKKMRKCIIAMIITLCLATSVCAYTIFDRDPNDPSYLGVGKLWCEGTDTYNAEASTYALDYGEEGDYVKAILSFDETNPSLSATYSAEGLDSATASGRGYVPNYIRGTHEVRRGNTSWHGATSVSRERLLEIENNNSND